MIRKILMSIVVGLLSVWTIYFMIYGLSAIGVKGFIGLRDENKMLEREIETLNKTINNSYSGALLTLDSTKDNLIDTKTEYENQAALSSLNNKSYTAEKFTIELLWTKLGNFAKDEKVTIKMDVTETGIDTDLYNLKFTVTGDYNGITNYIYDIEKDATLGFKIDNFQMSGSGEQIEATFECKEIYVDLGKKLETEDDKVEEDTTAIETNPEEDDGTEQTVVQEEQSEETQTTVKKETLDKIKKETSSTEDMDTLMNEMIE